MAKVNKASLLPPPPGGLEQATPTPSLLLGAEREGE